MFCIILNLKKDNTETVLSLNKNKKSKMFFFAPHIWNTHQLPTTSQPAILMSMIHLSQANMKQMSQLCPSPYHNGAANVTVAPY